jgi:hypothetical protein
MQWRAVILLSLLLLAGSPALWAADQSQPQASLFTESAGKTDSFAADAQVMLFSPVAGQWMLAAFEQARPGSEFYSRNQLYRVLDSKSASVVPNINATRLLEADIQLDKASRRPHAGDVVQVLDKDMGFVAHALLEHVRPGAVVRFQGRAYKVKADAGLVNTGVVFSSAAANLQRIEITPSALQHVLDRHTVGGTMTAGKSVFNSGEDIRALIRSAELVDPTPQARGNDQRIVDAGRMIGVDRQTRRQTSTYTVITTSSGKLVTAFPGLP